MTNAKSSEMPVEELIAHYQRSIKKSQNDSKRVRMNETSQNIYVYILLDLLFILKSLRTS